MSLKKKLLVYFSIAGFIGSCAGTIFLVWYFGREGRVDLDQSVKVALGLPTGSYLFAIPLVGTVFSVLWTLPIKPENFGALEGSKVSIFSFLSVCVLVSLFEIGQLPANVFVFAVLGFMLFGWALVILGLYTGFLFRGNTHGVAL